MRLIDAKQLEKQVKEAFETLNPVLMGQMLRWIRKQQTIDAVPVVRCWECKNFRHYGKTSLFINGKNIKAGWCQRRISYDEEYRMTADDFCSYGERKEGAD